MRFEVLLSYLLLVGAIVLLDKRAECHNQDDIPSGLPNHHLKQSPAATEAGAAAQTYPTSDSNYLEQYTRQNRIERFDFRCPEGSSESQPIPYEQTYHTNNIQLTKQLQIAHLHFCHILDSIERDEDDDQPQKGNITIIVSPRVLPQLVARIYAIYLKDRLRSGHTIQFKTQELRAIPPEVKVGEISLENYQMVDSHEQGQGSHHGTLYPTGVIGWFVPTALIDKR